MLLFNEIKESHFNNRVRWYKNPETGKAEKKGLDRGWLGLRVKGRPWLEAVVSDPEAVVPCFVYGVDHICMFLYDGRVYANKNNSTQAEQYAIALANMRGGLEIVPCEDMPTAVKASRGGGARTLEDMLVLASQESSDSHGF